MVLKQLGESLRNVFLLGLSFSFFLSTEVLAQTEIFKVTDSKGNVSYQSEEPASGIDYEVQLVAEPEEGVVKSEDEVVKQEENIEKPEDKDIRTIKAQEKFPLVLFSIPKDSETVCDACDYLRFYLNEHSLPFEELDGETNFYVQERLKKATGEYKVPVLLIGEKPVAGFSRTALEKALGAAGYFEVSVAEEIDAELETEISDTVEIENSDDELSEELEVVE